ncbi:probable tyrosyl-DNA phosphodiesterase [Onthophagus taurus]|uniref:probable tyrosyl-DNA phosphodiesterase n=1 Tax=Onthophagus taurus TaxID=166361 RepID=UPI0039BE83A0
MFTKKRKIDMATKLENNRPYNIFFSSINQIPETLQQRNSITFSDLLCPSLGELKCSLQINFLIDIPWIIDQYKVHKVDNTPITILYGKIIKENKQGDYKIPSNIKHKEIICNQYGTHHSKLGVYVYSDNSLRIIVSTANLFKEDWSNYNQGIWVSPKCFSLPEGSLEKDGESPTGFKTSLLKYLDAYSKCKAFTSNFEDIIKKTDFSHINVFLVTSTPGNHSLQQDTGCHLLRTRDLLNKYCDLSNQDILNWEINAQASSIGSLQTPEHWLLGDFLTTLKSAILDQEHSPHLNVIFPTAKNVQTSLFREEGGKCLSYLKSNDEKQLWVRDYLFQWSANYWSRTHAMPHIKTYCRISPCKSKLAWLLLTSANISVAAWGNKINKQGTSYVRSYEVGVLFLPKFFNQEFFNIAQQENANSFPFIYDTDLIPYDKDDNPYYSNLKF